VEAAATKPFGFQAFYPGPGVGGHCIPLDPQFLAWRAREERVPTRFIDLAADVNPHMPDYVVSRVSDLLNQRGLPVKGTKILALGLSYKRNIGDDPESPSLDVVERLAARGAVIGVVDPHVPADRLARHVFEVVDADSDLSSWTMAVLLTDHDSFNYAQDVDVVFDTRGVYRRVGVASDNVVTL
jgi:UDP-N-acetyl-D-glucosamine dehydrogenase